MELEIEEQKYDRINNFVETFSTTYNFVVWL